MNIKYTKQEIILLLKGLEERRCENLHQQRLLLIRNDMEMEHFKVSFELEYEEILKLRDKVLRQLDEVEEK